MSTWLLLSPAAPGRLDGIGDYAGRLARALSSRVQIELVCETEHIASWRDLDGEPWRRRAADVAGVLLQYSPAPPLARDGAPLRRFLRRVRAAGRTVVVTAHELWPPAAPSLRRVARRVLLKRALFGTLAQASAVVVTQDVYAALLRAEGLSARTPLAVIPAGSNIDRVEGHPRRSSTSLVMFGQPASMDPAVMAAVGRWLSSAPPAVTLTWCSRSAEEARAWWAAHVGAPFDRVQLAGGLDERSISILLSEAAIGLGPYADGATGRRTTLSAMLQHGLPIASVAGAVTDRWLTDSHALSFSPVDEPTAFPGNIGRLLADPGRRQVLSEAAERLYASRLSWPTIAGAYHALMQSAGGPR